MKKSKKIESILKDQDEVVIPEIVDRALTNYNSGDNFSFEEKEFKSNPVASKFFTLFDEKLAEEQATVIRVKHIRAPKGDRWRVFNGTKVTQTIDGTKLLKKEREFLNTIRGLQLLLEKSKQGPLTIASLKKDIKIAVESPPKLR